jgi:hypothetical protein
MAVKLAPNVAEPFGSISFKFLQMDSMDTFAGKSAFVIKKKLQGPLACDLLTARG